MKYDKSLPREMYKFFTGYEDSGSAPSFIKFAQQKGLTLAAIEDFRKHRKFEEAYRECSEIRRDYLIDRALTRRYDSSFVKFLLTDESTDSPENEDLSVKLEVLS